MSKSNRGLFYESDTTIDTRDSLVSNNIISATTSTATTIGREPTESANPSEPAPVRYFIQYPLRAIDTSLEFLPVETIEITSNPSNDDSSYATETLDTISDYYAQPEPTELAEQKQEEEEESSTNVLSHRTTRSNTSTTNYYKYAGNHFRGTHPWIRSWSAREIRPQNCSTPRQASVRVQRLDPSTIIADKYSSVSKIVDKCTRGYVGNKHKYNPGWNCWSVRQVDKKSLIVYQWMRNVVFTDETTYYSDYSAKKQVRGKPFQLLPWVRTCVELKRRIGYADPVERRFHAYVYMGYRDLPEYNERNQANPSYYCNF